MPAKSNLQFQKVSALVAIENARTTKKMLDTSKKWTQLIVLAIALLILTVVKSIQAVASKNAAFISHYDKSMNHLNQNPQLASITMSTFSRSGRNVALAAEYPWLNKMMLGNTPAFAKACIIAFNGPKFGPCILASEQHGALYFSSIWSASFEDANISAVSLLCKTFYNCAKEDCAPACESTTMSDFGSFASFDIAMGSLSTGLGGAFLGSAGTSFMKKVTARTGIKAGAIGLLAGAVTGGVLSYFASQSAYNDMKKTCLYNAKYTSCWAPPGTKVCGEYTCANGNGPCTNIDCALPLDSINATCDGKNSAGSCQDKQFLLPPTYKAGCDQNP